MSGHPVQQHTTYPPPHQQGAYNHQAAPGVQPQTPLIHHDHHPENHARSHNAEWENSFCSCSPLGTCCLGCWCPCILYGRTNYRLEHGSTKGYTWYNMNCCFYGCLVLASPMQTFLGYFQRKKIREKLGLKGGCCGDCLRHCCCPCCALTQEEKEVTQKTKNAGYQASAGMHYPK